MNHFLDFDHKLDFSSTKSFDASLSKFLKVILIDSLIFYPKDTQVMKEKACEIREGYFQTQLKTLERFGGMNTLDSHKINFKSSSSNINK